jgi:uncharacterized membrane protein
MKSGMEEKLKKLRQKDTLNSMVWLCNFIVYTIIGTYVMIAPEQKARMIGTVLAFLIVMLAGAAWGRSDILIEQEKKKLEEAMGEW